MPVDDAVPILLAVPTLPGGPGPVDGIAARPPDPAPAVEIPAPVRVPAGPDPDRPVFEPVTRAASGPSRSHRHLRTRASIAIAGALVSMGATAWSIATLLERRDGAIQLRDGALGVERFEQLDDRVVLASWVDLGALVLAGIVGIVWFRRAYKNLRAMGRNAYGPGWAIAGWIVPIMSLFRPYQMAKELVRESPRVRGTAGTGIVGMWWLLFVAGSFGSRAIARLPEDSLDDVIRNDMLRVVLLALFLVAGLAWIAVIRTVTRRQDAWFDPVPAEPPAGSPPADAPSTR